jgi:hypothetical protein
MKPSLSEILGGGAFTLASGVLPQLETAPPYVRGNVAAVMMLLTLAAQESETAAPALARANLARFALLTAALADAPLPDDLARHVRETLNASPLAAIRLSDLSAVHARLNGVLIQLHIWAEGADWSGAAALETAILAELAQSAREQRLDLPPM